MFHNNLAEDVLPIYFWYRNAPESERHVSSVAKPRAVVGIARWNRPEMCKSLRALDQNNLIRTKLNFVYNKCIRFMKTIGVGLQIKTIFLIFNIRN